MSVKRQTPILFVERIEPCLDFWVAALGYVKTIEVPGKDGRLGFVALEHGGHELMLQTYPSLAEDLPQAYERARAGASFLFIEVDDLEAVMRKLAGFTPLIDRRKTFYGATESLYVEPGGHYITFAEMEAGSGSGD